MENIITTNKKTWCEFITDRYLLPIDLILKNKFTGDILINNINSNVSFAKVCAVPHTILNTKKRESFIFIFTNKEFSWSNDNKCGKNKNGGSIIIDCMKDYKVDFPNGNFTKSFTIDYDTLSDYEISNLKNKESKNLLFKNEYINYIMRNTNIDDKDILSKINIIKNLSLIDFNHQDELIFKVKYVIYNSLLKGETLSIDKVSSQLCLSTRNLQIKLKNKNKNYMKILDEIRNENIKLSDNTFIYEKIINSGFKTTSAFYMKKNN
jgi:hypothetical protein